MMEIRGHGSLSTDTIMAKMVHNSYYGVKAKKLLIKNTAGIHKELTQI